MSDSSSNWTISAWDSAGSTADSMIPEVPESPGRQPDPEESDSSSDSPGRQPDPEEPDSPAISAWDSLGSTADSIIPEAPESPGRQPDPEESDSSDSPGRQPDPEETDSPDSPGRQPDPEEPAAPADPLWSMRYFVAPFLSNEEWTRTLWQCPCPFCDGHWWWISTMGNYFCEDRPNDWTRYRFEEPHPGFWWHNMQTGEYFFE